MDLLTDLLPLVDDLERALAADAQDGEAYRRGVEIIHKQLLDLLTSRGVTPIEAHGADVAESVCRAELGLMTGALTGLSDRDRRRLVGLIDRMIDNFDTYAPASASDSSDSE